MSANTLMPSTGFQYWPLWNWEMFMNNFPNIFHLQVWFWRSSNLHITVDDKQISWQWYPNCEEVPLRSPHPLETRQDGFHRGERSAIFCQEARSQAGGWRQQAGVRVQACRQPQAWGVLVPRGRQDWEWGAGHIQGPGGGQKHICCDIRAEWCGRDRRWTLQSESQEQVWRS